MALAGDMKLRNFLLMAGLGVALPVGAFVGLGFYVVANRPPVEHPPERQAPERVVIPASPAPAVAEPAYPREVDARVFELLGHDLGSSKRKDVTQGEAYKVNVYQDEGHKVANRAKVDLDRDDKWDEKWTFDAGEVSRKVAPADDEQYAQVFVWTGQGWAAR